MARELYLGTSGWWYGDWKEYFQASSPTKLLDYLLHIFNAIEINVTFYRPVESYLSRHWVRRVKPIPNFRFTAKLFRRFTHDRSQPPSSSEVQQFLRGLEPLREAGLLEALLAQFPWSFRCEPEALDWLQRVIVPLAAFTPVVVEVRHDSWLRQDGWRHLQEMGLGFCNIDQPRLRHCLPVTSLVLGPIGYFRLHGRNARRWFEHEEAHERYDYLYSRDELRELVPHIQKVQQQAQKLFVFCNNHYRAKAVANAVELKYLLLGQKSSVPLALLEAYPQLVDVAVPTLRGDAQKKLFE